MKSTFHKLQQNKNLQLTFPLLLASALCFLLISARMFRTESFRYIFLIWNLFLAWMPLLFAVLLHSKIPPKGFLGMPNAIISFSQKVVFVGLLCGWLVFFPNSPYIISDLIHLSNQNSAELVWFDAVLIFCFAFTGLQVGLLSLYLVERAISKGFGKIHSFIFTYGSVFLTGFGIYMGRNLRFNSWEILTNPFGLLVGVFRNLNYQAFHTTLLYSTVVLVLYLVFKSFVGWRNHFQQEEIGFWR